MYSSTEQLETVWDCYELTTVNQIRVRQSIQDRSSSLYAPPIQVYLVYQRNVCVLFNPVDVLYLKGTRTRCDKLSPIQQEEVQFTCLHVTTQDSLGMGSFIQHWYSFIIVYGECCCVWTTLQCKIHHHFKRERVQDFGPITSYLVSHSVTLDHLIYFMASLWLAEPSTHWDRYPFLLVDQAVVVFFGYNYTMRHLSQV